MKIFKLLIPFLLLMGTLLFNVPTSEAAASGYLKGYNLYKVKSVSINKTTLVVKLDKKIQYSSKFIVTDDKNKKIPAKISLSLQSGGTSLNVSPASAFLSGNAYRIYISNAVKLSRNKYQSAIIPFTGPKKPVPPKPQPKPTINYIKNTSIQFTDILTKVVVETNSDVYKVQLSYKGKNLIAHYMGEGKYEAVIQAAKAGEKFTVTVYNDKGSLLGSKEYIVKGSNDSTGDSGSGNNSGGSTSTYVTGVTVQYNSIVTNIKVQTSADVFKTVIEYGGKSYEAHYSGNNVYDLGLQNAALNTTGKIKVFNDQGTLLGSKDFTILVSTETGDGTGSNSGDTGSNTGGTTPAASVLKDVQIHYSTVVTNVSIVTDDSVYKVVIDYNGQKLEAHFEGANTYDIALPKAEKGSKIKILSYSDQDVLVETKEYIIQ